MTTKQLKKTADRFEAMLKAYEGEQQKIRDFLKANQTDFRKYIRKEAIELAKAGVKGDFNKDYTYTYKKGDMFRIDWKWSHYQTGQYFLRFYCKGDSHKESLCFHKRIDITPFIEQTKRDVMLKLILAKKI